MSTMNAIREDSESMTSGNIDPQKIKSAGSDDEYNDDEDVFGRTDE